jgi:hypothetical protein
LGKANGISDLVPAGQYRANLLVMPGVALPVFLLYAVVLPAKPAICAMHVNTRKGHSSFIQADAGVHG